MARPVDISAADTAAEASLALMGVEMAQAPLGFASWLSALDFALSEPNELTIVGPDAPPMLRFVRYTYRPDLVVAAASGATTHALKGPASGDADSSLPYAPTGTPSTVRLAPTCAGTCRASARSCLSMS